MLKGNAYMTTQADDVVFGAFLRQSGGCITVEQMLEGISVFAKNFGCQWVAYGTPVHVQNSRRKYLNRLETISNYPRPWQEHCLKEGYDKLDPSVKARQSQSLPILWGTAYCDPNTTDRERRIFDEAREFGLKAGVTVPLHGRWGDFSILNFGQTEENELTKFAIDCLQLAGLFFHLKVGIRLDLNGDRPRLTPREEECMFWIAQGKSSGVIASLLGISPNTVDFHIKSIHRKLGTGNRTVAAIKALTLGLIEMQ